jgi:hypothetical protein
MTLDTIQAAIVVAAILAPIVTAVVSGFKSSFVEVPARFIPVVSMVIGIIFGLAIIDCSIYGGLAGLISGLAGTGLWEFGKTTIAGTSTKTNASGTIDTTVGG